MEMWSLTPEGALAIERINMYEVPPWFDFKESSISNVYARRRTVYVRDLP